MLEVLEHPNHHNLEPMGLQEIQVRVLNYLVEIIMLDNWTPGGNVKNLSLLIMRRTALGEVQFWGVTKV